MNKRYKRYLKDDYRPVATMEPRDDVRCIHCGERYDAHEAFTNFCPSTMRFEAGAPDER